MRSSTAISLILATFVAFSGSSFPGNVDLGGWLGRIINPDRPTPDSPDVAPDSPSATLQALVAPITQALGEDRSKARLVASAFAGYSAVLSGPFAADLRDTRQLEAVFGQVNQRLGLEGGASIGRQVQDAIASHVGIAVEGGEYEDRNLTAADHERLAEVFAAVSWAARQGG